MEAIRLQETAISIARNIGNYSLESGVQRLLGNAAASYLVVGDYEKASTSCKDALEIVRQGGNYNYLNELGTLGELGRAQTALGLYHDAIVSYNDAIDLCVEHEVAREYAKVLGNISIPYSALGNNDAALKSARESAELSKNLGQRSLISYNFGHLAKVHLDRFEYGLALEKALFALDQKVITNNMYVSLIAAISQMSLKVTPTSPKQLFAKSIHYSDLLLQRTPQHAFCQFVKGLGFYGLAACEVSNKKDNLILANKHTQHALELSHASGIIALVEGFAKHIQELSTPIIDEMKFDYALD